MPRQTRAELELLVNSLRAEAHQNRVIYSTKDQELRATKDRIERLESDLKWTRLMCQNLAEVLRNRS